MSQLVQFLLKQAGVDKRTGDLYGNRDFLNIARNMARGLKVCLENFYYLLPYFCFSFSFVSLALAPWGITSALVPGFSKFGFYFCRGLRMYTLNTSLFYSKPWKALSREGWEMWTIHVLEIIFNRAGLLAANHILVAVVWFLSHLMSKKKVKKH